MSYVKVLLEKLKLLARGIGAKVEHRCAGGSTVLANDAKMDIVVAGGVVLQAVFTNAQVAVQVGVRKSAHHSVA